MIGTALIWVEFYVDQKSEKLATLPETNPQYLVNGESDQKMVTNKKDADFNCLSEIAIKFNT